MLPVFLALQAEIDKIQSLIRDVPVSVEFSPTEDIENEDRTIGVIHDEETRKLFCYIQQQRGQRLDSLRDKEKFLQMTVEQLSEHREALLTLNKFVKLFWDSCMQLYPDAQGESIAIRKNWRLVIVPEQPGDTGMADLLSALIASRIV